MGDVLPAPTTNVPPLMLARGLELADSLEHIYTSLLVQGEITHSERLDGLTFSGAIEDLLPSHFNILRIVRTPYRHELLAQGRSQLLLLSGASDGLHAHVGACSAQEVRALADALRDAADTHRADSLLVSSWSNMAGRAQLDRRHIDARPWSDIACNYPRSVGGALERIMVTRPPASSALMLWHGPAGSGKTTAALALMHAWRAWCEPHLVLDPAQMLTDSRYLTDLVRGRRGRQIGDPAWRLLVCEDVGSHIAGGDGTVTDAMSRLLNVTDGIFGRGSKVIVLLTTNAEARTIHPALQRPGRCLASVSFRWFDQTEASTWLGADPGQGSFSLAELLARRGSIASVIEAEPAPVAGTGMYL